MAYATGSDWSFCIALSNGSTVYEFLKWGATYEQQLLATWQPAWCTRFS